MKALLTVLLLLIAAPAVAGECRKNMSWDLWRFRMGIENPTPLSAEDHIKFIRNYNSTPPVSDFTAQVVYIYLMEDGSALALFVKDGCVIHGDSLSKWLVEGWLGEQAI